MIGVLLFPQKLVARDYTTAENILARTLYPQELPLTQPSLIRENSSPRYKVIESL